MSRESPYFRDILAEKLEYFGKRIISANEFSKYLGMANETVRKEIRSGNLPGTFKKVGANDKFYIPVASIALWEIKQSEVN